MGIDIKKAAKKAAERQVIHPKFKLGSTGMEEGSCIVEFLQPTFGEAINKKPLPGQTGDFLTMLVRVVEDDDFGHAAGEGPLAMSVGPGSTLGDGVLKLWNNHNENLLGVVAKITCYNYHNQKFNKLTRAYRVEELPNRLPGQKPSPTQ